MPVVFVVMILTAFAVTLATSAQREIRASANHTARTQRFYAARGALNYALSALAKTSDDGAMPGRIPPAGNTDANGWMEMGAAWVKIEVVDTAARINLNTASEAALDRLPALRGNRELIAAIVDWRSPGDQPSAYGAKSEYYQSLPTPYRSRNAAFDTAEELLLVRGMTPELLYQPPDPQGGAPSPSGGEDGGLEEIYASSRAPLCELLTTLVKERNVSADGAPRANINTATAEELQQIGIPAELAQQIVSYRAQGQENGNNASDGNPPEDGQPNGPNQPGAGGGAGGPGGARPGLGGRPTLGNRPGLGGRPRINSSPQTRQAPGGFPNQPGGGTPGGGNPGGGSPGGNNPGGNGPGNGSGNGNGDGNGSGGSQGQGFQSIADLLNIPTFTPGELERLADRVTVDSGAFRRNVVNINTAPPETLATIPGITRATIQTILRRRQGGQEYRTLGDLFAMGEGSISREQLQAITNYLTTKSSVYLVRLKVRTPGQQSLYAVSALVEMTEEGPKVRQWRETPRYPGWSNWLPLTPSDSGEGRDGISASYSR